MLHFWKQFLVEGDKLYEYLINNFDDMFDGDKIKHFDIRCHWPLIQNIKKIRNKYIIDIEHVVIDWIKNEKKNNRLFDKTLWKPFRDQYYLSDMYYGYRYLFQYKNYYFQLAMETHCLTDNCRDCIEDEDVYENTSHFKLEPFAFIDSESNTIQPYKNLEILEDNMMPEFQWNNNQ